MQFFSYIQLLTICCDARVGSANKSSVFLRARMCCLKRRFIFTWWAINIQWSIPNEEINLNNAVVTDAILA